MGRLSIDHLNRKREQLHATSGGKNYAKSDRMISAATERAWAEAAAEHVPTLEEEVAAVFDDFRSFVRNLLPVDVVVELGRDDAIPF